LSQCGTFFALRLSNGDDQGRVKATVPDALSGLIDLLPALRTGEALVMGEGVQIPSRIRLPLIEPRPRSDDPEPAKRWKEVRVADPPYAKAVTAWRRQRTEDQ
jgi:DNA helicase HerA-like ATPase